MPQNGSYTGLGKCGAPIRRCVLQAEVSAVRLRNRKLALDRKGRGEEYSAFFSVSFSIAKNMFIVVRRINGRTVSLGYFDIEADAAKAADAVSRRLGEHSKCNFTEDGTPTDYGSSLASRAISTANLTAASTAKRHSQYSGVSRMVGRRSDKQWYVRFSVKNCTLNKTACQSVAAKCGCGTTEIRSTHFYLTEVEAAREHDILVRRYDLPRDLHFPVGPQVS